MFANNVCKYINITRVKHPCPTTHIKRSEQNDHIFKKATMPLIMQQVADRYIQTEEYPAESSTFIKATSYKSTNTQTDSVTVEYSIIKVHQLTY